MLTPLVQQGTHRGESEQYSSHKKNGQKRVAKWHYSFRGYPGLSLQGGRSSGVIDSVTSF